MIRTFNYSDRLLSMAAVAGLGILSAAMFAGELFLPGDTVRSHYIGDLSLYFIQIRRFGFEELATGNLALWNPHLFSGTPFVGSFQSAMLYPINLLYLVFSLAKAIHIDLSVHVFLIGAFMFGWMRAKGVSVPAAFFAGGILMFSQPTFARILAGQLTLVAAFAWAPLLFWAADKIIEKPSLRWTLVGIGAASMQVVAGYPPFVFMTAIALALYCALCLTTTPSRLHAIIALGAVAIAPIFITAAQLWTGLYTMAESGRADGVSFDFATSYSFPPENFLTLVAPGFFGNFIEMPYWGRWIFWDANAFVGATALVCGALGVVYAPARVRVVTGLVAGLMFVLCLGHFTPVYRLFYEWVFGFDRFRGPSKFLFLLTMFWCVFAAFGMDHMIRKRPMAWAGWIAPAVLGSLLMGAAFAVWGVEEVPNSFFTAFMDKLKASPDWVSGPFFEPKRPKAASYAAWNLAGAGAACMLVAVGVAFARRSVMVPLALIGFGLVEVFGVGRTLSSTIQIGNLERPILEKFYEAHPSDLRVLDTAGWNHAVGVGAYSIWGYDPVILGRYIDFMELTEDRGMESGLKLPVQHHSLMDMLRCRFITLGLGRGFAPIHIREVGDPLPRALLIRDVVVCESRESVKTALMDAAFNPRETVVLEEPAGLSLDKDDTRGRIEILDSSTDHLTLSIDTPSPAVLLITDSYSRGWRAVSLNGSSEFTYRVLPANCTLRAIPIPSGQHRIRVEYAPWPFRVGKWVSIVSIALFAAAAVWTFRS